MSADAATRRGASSAAAPEQPEVGSARLLAIDTSTLGMAVAAAGPAGACTLNAAGGAAASEQLLPCILRALEEAGLAWPALDAIAFGRGPGAFTGLRTSAAVAQGLALGLARPVLPIDSLLIVAEDARAHHAPGTARGAIAVAMDARMDEIYGAVFRWEPASTPGASAQDSPPSTRPSTPPAPQPSTQPCTLPSMPLSTSLTSPSPGYSAAPRWQAAQPSALYTLAAWNALLRREAGTLQLLAGSAMAAFGERIHVPAGLTRVPNETDRAAALLRLAARAWADGEGVDGALALPLYLRDKVALTTAERQAGAAVAPSAPSSPEAPAAPASPVSPVSPAAPAVPAPSEARATEAGR